MDNSSLFFLIAEHWIIMVHQALIGIDGLHGAEIILLFYFNFSKRPCYIISREPRTAYELFVLDAVPNFADTVPHVAAAGQQKMAVIKEA